MTVVLIELLRLSLSVAIGLALARAGHVKLARPVWFRHVLKGYRLLPPSLIAPASRILPGIEIMLAAAVLLDVQQPWPMLATVALLVGLTGAVVINLFRGLRNIACGCFGSNSERTLSWGLVGRNFLLIGLATATALMPVFPPDQETLHFLLHLAVLITWLASVGCIALRREIIRRRLHAAHLAKIEFYMKASPALTQPPFGPVMHEPWATRTRSSAK